jgi:hypothetical protein
MSISNFFIINCNLNPKFFTVEFCNKMALKLFLDIYCTVAVTKFFLIAKCKMKFDGFIKMADIALLINKQRTPS